MSAPIVGHIGYAAGVSGTVTPAKGARILQIRAEGGTVVIFGGNTIPVAGVFDTRIDSFTEEWIGDGVSTIVFAGGTSYFVKWATKLT